MFMFSAAIAFYRRAVQLVPDIEFRVKDFSTVFPQTGEKQKSKYTY